MNTAATSEVRAEGAPPRVATSPVSAPVGLDHQVWVAHLRSRLVPDWRQAEFDPAAWLFTGDPGNPMTTSMVCKVENCDTVVGSRALCGRCIRALAGSEMEEQAFVESYRPPALTHQRLTGCGCSVIRDGLRCARRRVSSRTGLCQAHSVQWIKVHSRVGCTLQVWRAGHARPLPARTSCLVAGCVRDGKLDDGLCGHHSRFWRQAQLDQPRAHCETPPEWASHQLPRTLQVHQFSLAVLAPTMRWELLFALQQRDGQGLRLDPTAMRGLIPALAGLEALASTPRQEIERRTSGKAGNVRAYAQMLPRVIRLRLENFDGVTHTDNDVWDSLALDLDAPRPGRRPSFAAVDFTRISQRWLREAAKDWVRVFRPDSGQTARTLQACVLASTALATRPGGGHRQHDLRFTDIALVFEAIKNSTGTSGALYDARYRRGLWARFNEIIEFGRSTDQLAKLPATFSRHRSQSITQIETNEDEIGKAVPETMIAQLDDHLDLLGAEGTYGRWWSQTASATMFQTAYQILRDTGRRPGELVSLRADCVELDNDEYSLVYDNRKKNRLRRRLPITTDTAAIIQRWQHHRAGLDLPTSQQPWLFPAPTESSGPGHLSTIRFATAMRRWVAAIPALHSDLPTPAGGPAPFDRSLIYPYAFRHSYAQRHADAGVGLEILKELMDHRSMQVTQGYYKISLTRKRQAITLMSRYVHDRAGNPVPTLTTTDPATRYELKSVAVPFGNCIEPTNVKAGGKQCPIRFQCAGCGFYRPDPSYLPAIEEHINALRADRETALAMDVDVFVARNLADQAEAFARVAAIMRERIHELPEDERTELKQASAVLRKLRASHNPEPVRRLLPLTVTPSR